MVDPAVPTTASRAPGAHPAAILASGDDAAASWAVAIERAGFRVTVWQVAARALDSLPDSAPDGLHADLVIVDAALLGDEAARSWAAAVAALVPLVLLTRPKPSTDPADLSAVAAVAALPVPPDAGVFTASWPYWRLRHQQTLALRDSGQKLERALLDSRCISNAVGMVAERHGVSLADAFSLIRGHARSRRERVEQVARTIVDAAGRAAAGRSEAGLPPPLHTRPGDLP